MYGRPHFYEKETAGAHHIFPKLLAPIMITMTELDKLCRLGVFRWFINYKTVLDFK